MALIGRMSNSNRTSAGLTGRMAVSDTQQSEQITSREIGRLGMGLLRPEVARQRISQNPELLKQVRKTETISAAPADAFDKKWPLGFVGEMAKAAYNATKETIDNATQKLVGMTNRLGNEYSAEDYQKLAFREPTESFDQAASRLGIKKTTTLQRGIGMGEGALGVAGIGFLPVTAQLEAAKELPGPLAIPAKVASGIFQDLGRLGSFTLGKGVDVLPVSDETKAEIKPFAEELGAFIAQLVGIKAAHKVSSKGLNLEKLNLKETTKSKLSNTAQFATGISVTPFSTIYGMASSRIAYKVAREQARGVDVTPDVAKRIMEEVKQEIIDSPLPDIKTDKPEFIFEKPVEIPRAPVIGEAKADPLTLEASKYKSAEEFVKAQDVVYRGGTTDGKYLSTSKNIAEDFAKQRGGSVSEFVISPEAKVISYSDFPNAKYKGINDYNVNTFSQGKDLKTFQDTVLEADYIKAENWAKNNGYDVIKLPTEAEVRVINPKVLQTKSQLTDIWNKAQEALTSPKTAPTSDIKAEKGKTSGVAKSIEAKAIENNLTKGVKDLAEYDSRSFKEEAKKVADLINTDIEKARSIVRGEEATDIRAGALIAGIEEYAKAHPREAADIIQELANSPLTATISAGASETSFARMREKESAAYQLGEVKKHYESKVKDVDTKKTKLKKDLKKETEKFNLSKAEKSFNNFLDKIVC